MTHKELIKKLCEAEGLKSQVAIGDMREIVGIIADEMQKDMIGISALLVRIGKNRKKNDRKT
jgi:hypothetical protein